MTRAFELTDAHNHFNNNLIKTIGLLTAYPKLQREKPIHIKKGPTMNDNTKSISNKIKLTIGKVIHRCNHICDDVCMIFYLQNARGFKSQRNTYKTPENLLEFFVVTKTEKSATNLYVKWVIEDATTLDDHEYQQNLIIVSEDEFASEFGELDAFRERILSGIVVYDRDAQFVL